MSQEKIETFASAIVNSKELESALKFTKHSLNARSMYTDGCFLLEFTPNNLTVLANDYRSASRTIIGVDNPEGLASGNIFLGSGLDKLLATCNEQPVKLELFCKLTSVAAELTKFIKVITEDGEYVFESPHPHIVESPYKVIPDRKVVATIDSHDFLEGLMFASAAKLKDNSTEEIKGNVCLKLTKKKFSITATDGLRIHRYSTKHESEEVKEGSYLIDGKAVQIVSDFLKRNGKEDVSITTADNFFILQANTDEVMFRLYDTKYPDTDSVLTSTSGQDYKVLVQIRLDRLKAALKRAEIFKDDLRQCRLKLNANANELTIMDFNQKSIQTLSVETNGYSADLDVVLNVDHLISATNAMDCEEVLLKGKDEKSAIVIINHDADAKCNALLVTFKQK
jgi:DNA polymerase III sliding clamp (beta) subunit (PCNA family)